VYQSVPKELGYICKNGKKVSVFSFPKERLNRKQWTYAIRRDEGEECCITTLKVGFSFLVKVV
jgi:hypothetical protein